MSRHEHGHENDPEELGRLDDDGLLVASLFDELDADDRRALDARLAEEPALRARRDELARTVGVVRGAFPAGESLPPELLAGIERATRAGKPTTSMHFLRSRPLRAAAALVLLLGGALVAREVLSDDAPARESRLARFDGEAEGGRARRLAATRDESEDEFRPSVVLDEVGGEVRVKRQAYYDLDDPDARRALREHLGEIAENLEDEELEELAKAGLGLDPARGDGSGVPSSGSVSPPAPQEEPGIVNARKALGADDADHIGAEPELELLEGLGYVGDDDSEENDFFIGHGQPDAEAPAERPETRRVRAGTGGTHRGPGDTVAPRDGPSTPGPGGPSTPGPSGPGTPGPNGPSTPGGGGSNAHQGLSSGPDSRAFDRIGDDGYELSEVREVDSGERRAYTREELDALARQRCEAVLRHCRRWPDERPSAMFFRFWGDNAFELAHLDALSTFGADVDTASYALARRYVREGLLPEKAQVRTEEFVNYFRPDLEPPPPDSKAPFAVHTELATSRWGDDHWTRGANAGESGGAQRWMLRVGLRGREVGKDERQPLQLTFVVDTSGSMDTGNRLELVKHALRLLVTELDGRDSIALVAFGNEARQVLPMTSAANRGLIETAIHGLHANGGTNAEAGLRMGYELAGLTLAPGAHSRVVLLSDGVANIGETDQDRINRDVRAQRERGIWLNTVGVGMSNHDDVFLEQLANKGDGMCNYVDDEREARRALVENFTGAFEPIARDLKVQVEFDPGQVYRYRLLGYENRAIADADFRNDAVDAGEIGAGHQVVALYELEFADNASEEPLATVRVRWKAPTGAGRHPAEDVAAGEIAHPVYGASRTSWEEASQGFQRDACVAQFAEILRRSVHARGDSLDALITEASKLDAQLRDPDFTEFVNILRASRRLILEREPATSDLAQCIDALRKNRILRAQLEELRRGESAVLLEELEEQNARLEDRIRDLIRDELEEALR